VTCCLAPRHAEKITDTRLQRSPDEINMGLGAGTLALRDAVAIMPWFCMENP